MLILSLLSWMPSHASATPEAIAEWQKSVVLLVTGPAWCSGVVVDDEGTVATAHHCVASGLRPQVTTRSGTIAIGRTVATAPSEDLALLSVPDLAGKVPPLELRDSPVQIGEDVYGLGHPFAPAADRSPAMEGLLLWSVTEGIISAVGPRLIQTDAALNPGNSGGPVVDDQGRIVGITSRKLGGDNIAFASSAAQLQALLAAPRKRPLVQGTLGLGLALIGGGELDAGQGVEILVQSVIRDRVVLSGGFVFPSGTRLLALQRGGVWYPTGEVSGALRQRFGRGRWSTALEAGGGLYFIAVLSTDFDVVEERIWILPEPSEVAPGLYGRIGLGAAGMRVIAAQRPDQPDITWMLAFDLAWPGVLTTF